MDPQPWLQVPELPWKPGPTFEEFGRRSFLGTGPILILCAMAMWTVWGGVVDCGIYKVVPAKPWNRLEEHPRPQRQQRISPNRARYHYGSKPAALSWTSALPESDIASYKDFAGGPSPGLKANRRTAQS